MTFKLFKMCAVFALAGGMCSGIVFFKALSCASNLICHIPLWIGPVTNTAALANVGEFTAVMAA